MFTYGGSNSTATPTGIHFVSTRVVIENMETVIGPPTPLQLYAVCVRSYDRTDDRTGTATFTYY